jgi:hypothetical protein
MNPPPTSAIFPLPSLPLPTIHVLILFKTKVQRQAGIYAIDLIGYAGIIYED